MSKLAKVKAVFEIGKLAAEVLVMWDERRKANAKKDARIKELEAELAALKKD